MPDIGVIILAAGGSTRMGRPKQLLRYQGESLLRRAARTAIEAGGAPVIAVLGARADECRKELDGLAVVVEVNPDWERGMGTSLRRGVKLLMEFGPEVSAALVMLCDQPLVTAGDLRVLMEARRGDAGVVAAGYGGTVGVPCVFGRGYFPTLLGVGDGEGAKAVIRSAGDVVVVPIANAGRDVDTPEEFEGLGQ